MFLEYDFSIVGEDTHNNVQPTVSVPLQLGGNVPLDGSPKDTQFHCRKVSDSLSSFGHRREILHMCSPKS